MPTEIQWTDETWNCVRGCSRVSSGCGDSDGGGCYAERQAYRFSGPGMPYEGLVRMTPKGPRWTGKVVLVEDKLNDPLHWKKPRRIFVNSMSDLFHEALSDSDIARVFATMWAADHHTYQILTKRPERMRQWVTEYEQKQRSANRRPISQWHHVWLGVSVEDQKTADERIPLLLQTPAAVRWISAEPLLGPIHLDADWLPPIRDSKGEPLYQEPQGLRNTLQWIVVGGESGPNARGLDVSWARSIVRQCQSANVPVFVKQLGAHPFERKPAEGPQGVRAALANIEKPHPQRTWFGDGWTLISKGEISEWIKGYTLKDKKGGDINEFPVDLRVREFPVAA